MLINPSFFRLKKVQKSKQKRNAEKEAMLKAKGVDLTELASMPSILDGNNDDVPILFT